MYQIINSITRHLKSTNQENLFGEDHVGLLVSPELLDGF